MGILSITLQDLRFRARQFLIAVIGAGLVFAMGLLLTGLAAGFSTEINQTVQGMGADSWVLAAGAAGRIAGLSPLPITAVSAVAHETGVTRADPIVVAPQAAQTGSTTISINMIGAQPGGLGSPTVTGGRSLAGNGEAVVDTRLGLGIGRHFTVAGLPFTVVGTVADRTLLGGVPNAYVTLHDAQAVLFGGRPLISAVLTSGIPAQAPAGAERAHQRADRGGQPGPDGVGGLLDQQLPGLQLGDLRVHRRRPRLRHRVGADA